MEKMIAIYPRGEWPIYLAEAVRRYEEEHHGSHVTEVELRGKAAEVDPGRAVRQLERTLLDGKPFGGCLDERDSYKADDKDFGRTLLPDHAIPRGETRRFRS